MFEPTQVYFGFASKYNVNRDRQILGKGILYEHHLQIRQCLATAGLTHPEAHDPSRFQEHLLISELFHFEDNPSGGWERNVSSFEPSSSALLYTHPFWSPPEQGQLFCQLFKH